MLSAIQVFLLLLSGFFSLCILVGLYKPVLVLWFMDRFNRQKVLAFYGKAIFFTLLLWRIFVLVEEISE
ncbi:hypothetical protein D0X99_07345 [Algoriphagus lacus]|uniref:Uncharacterized protein n=1 Tax=Algoriphagus lacus TaxID=2056311 RepID=A0A418PSW8_9BACT|nr:hypothetical protein D0X99_07345 [Algoriphagus lacus]